MPTTRKSTRSTGGGPKQATLSFNHRVTKPVPKSAKDAVVSAGSKDTAPAKPSPLSKSAKPEDEDEDEAVVPPTEEQEPDEVVVPVPVPAPAPETSEAELEAAKITDARIGRYWRGIEAQRLAKPVHQEELGTGEKVLRYFDVSSQYGVSWPLLSAVLFRAARWLGGRRKEDV